MYEGLEEGTREMSDSLGVVRQRSESRSAETETEKPANKVYVDVIVDTI